jgi:hypothetical protein
MATYYAHAAGNWSAANAFNTLANGTGTDMTADANGTVGTTSDTVDLNALAMVMDVNVQQALVQASTGSLTISGTRTLTGKIKYSGSGTTTSGMVQVPDGTALTIAGPGSGNVVENTGSQGHAIYVSGSGALTITNGTGTGCVCSSTGRAVNMIGSGLLTITCSGGTAISQGTSAGYCVVTASTGGSEITGLVNAVVGQALTYSVGAAGTNLVTGNITISGTGTGLSSSSGTVTFDGIPSGTGSGYGLYAYTGTIIWTGARTIAAGTYCHIAAASTGALNLTDLTVTLSGCIVINKVSGTPTITLTRAAINRQSAAALAAGLGLDISSIVNGPTLPAAADVQAGAVDFGYAGAPLDPAYPTTATTNAAHLAADKALLNLNTDEMIAANADIRGRFDCDIGTAAGGGGGGPLVGASALISV